MLRGIDIDSRKVRGEELGALLIFDGTYDIHKRSLKDPIHIFKSSAMTKPEER